MGIKITGMDDMAGLILAVESEGTRRVVKEMIRGGEMIRDLAREMAPVDYGNLEQAIQVEVSPARDSRGRFAARTVNVYVDLDLPVPQYPGKTVGDYAWFVHEHVTPFGPKGLGELSRIKQAGTNVVVGGGYLERAAEQIQKQVLDNIERAWRS